MNNTTQLRHIVNDRIHDLALVASGIILTPEKPVYQQKTEDAIMQAIADYISQLELPPRMDQVSDDNEIVPTFPNFYNQALTDTTAILAQAVKELKETL